MPSLALPEEMFRADAVVPPMVLKVDPACRLMPALPFGMAALPAALRPAMLPSTVFNEAFHRVRPSRLLPDRRFASPASVPPMVLALLPSDTMRPDPPLATAAVPAALVPIWLPITMLLLLAFNRLMPS